MKKTTLHGWNRSIVWSGDDSIMAPLSRANCKVAIFLVCVVCSYKGKIIFWHPLGFTFSAKLVTHFTNDITALCVECNNVSFWTLHMLLCICVESVEEVRAIQQYWLNMQLTVLFSSLTRLDFGEKKLARYFPALCHFSRFIIAVFKPVYSALHILLSLLF